MQVLTKIEHYQRQAKHFLRPSRAFDSVAKGKSGHWRGDEKLSEIIMGPAIYWQLLRQFVESGGSSQWWDD